MTTARRGLKVKASGYPEASTLPFGADAAMMTRQRSDVSPRSNTTLRSRRTARSSVVMSADVFDFARQMTDNLMQITGQGRADSMQREAQLRNESLQREQMLVQSKLETEKLLVDASEREKERAEREKELSLIHI